MRTLLTLFFTLILNSSLSASSFGEWNEQDSVVVVKSFIAGYETSFNQWPSNYYEFLGGSCLSLIVSNELQKDFLRQRVYSAIGNFMENRMRIFFHTKNGAKYITRENYHKIGGPPPPVCYLISDGSEFPLQFFDAMNRGPLCFVYSETNSGKLIYLPKTYKSFSEEVQGDTDYGKWSEAFSKTSRLDSINKTNYLLTYFSAALKQIGSPPSYEAIQLIQSGDTS